MIYVLIFAVFWPIITMLDLTLSVASWKYSRMLDESEDRRYWSNRSVALLWMCITCPLWPIHLLIGIPTLLGHRLGKETRRRTLVKESELKLAKEEIAKEETRIRALIRNEALDPLGLLGDDAKKPMRGEVLGALAVRTMSLPDRYPTRSTRTLTEIYSEPFEQR